MPLLVSVAAFRIVRKVSLAVPLFALTGSLSAQASTFTWAGGTTGTWTNAASWGGTAPGSGDTASFAGSGAQTASMNGTSASVGGIAVTSTGTTTLQGGTGAASTLTLGTGGITASAGTLVVGGTGTLTLAVSGSQNWTNNSAGTMTIGTGTATSTLTTGAAGTSTITLNGTGAVVLGGNIMDGTSGNGPLALAISSGSVTLGVGGGVTSNYSGGTTLSGGALELLTADALGNGALTITGGTLDTAGAGGVVTAANAVNINGSFTFGTANNHSLVFTGATNISNADTVTVSHLDLTLSSSSSTTFAAGSTLTVAGGGFLIFGSNTSANTWSAAATNTITVTGSQLEFELANGAVVANNIVNNVSSGLIDNGTGTTTFSGVISGTGNFDHLGAGESLLTGTNTYAKGTAISAGSVQFAKILSMPATGTVTVSSGATLAVNAGGSGEWTNGTSGAGTIGGLYAGVGGQTGSVVTLNSGSAVGIDTTDATGVFTYSGNITNVGVGLAKLGTGTLALGGSNSFTGATTLTGGTLQYNGTSAASSGSAMVINGSGGTLGLNLLNDTTGTFATAGITLSGSNGTLNLDADPLTSASGQTLTLGGAITTTSNATGNVINVTSANGYNVALGAISIVSTTTNTPSSHTLQLNAASGLNVSTGTVTYGSFGGELILGGTGTITVAQLNYNSNDAAGTVIGDGTSGNSPTVTFTAGPTSSGRSSGSAAYTLNSGVFNITNANIFADPNGSATTLTINGGKIENTSGTAVASANSTGAITLGGNFSFGNSTDTGTGSVTIGSSAAIGYIKEAAADVTITLNGGGGLSLIGPLTSTIGTNTLTVNNGSGTGATTAFTISGMNLSNASSSGTQTINGTGNVVITGTITNGGSTAGTVAGSFTTAAAGTLIYSGSGTLTLGGTSSFSGGLNVNSGTVAASAGTSAFGSSSNAINVNGGTLSIGANNETTGTVTLASGTIAGTTGTLTGASYAVQSGTVTAILGGAGGLTKTTAGSVLLSNDNTYTGSTTISAGVIQIGIGTGGSGSSALGNTSKSLTLATTGTLDLNGFSTTIGTLLGSGTVLNSASSTTGLLTFNNSGVAGNSNTFSGVIENNAGSGGTVAVQKNGADLEIFTGNNTYTGTTTVSTGTLQIGNGTSGTIASTSTITMSGSGAAIAFDEANGTTISNTIVDTPAGDLVVGAEGAGSTNTLSGVISGAFGGGFLQSGAGTTILTNADTYTGTTTISTGTLQLGNGGTTGKILSTGTIVDNGTFAIDRSNAVAQGTDFGSAAITGSGGFTQAGSGTTTLSASNSYLGTTTINAGALNITGSTSSTGAVIINSGGTLKGTGSTGLITLNSGGSINLTDGVIGTLTIGSLTTTGGGSLTFDIGGGTTNVDKISDTGLLSASSLTTVNLNAISGSLSTGTYTFLSYGSGSASIGSFQLTGGASSLSIDGKTLTLAQSGDNLEIIVASTTGTTYTLSTSAGATLLHSGATTTLTTTVTNTGTGTADTLNYSGLGATAANGTVTGTLTSGGPLANNSAGTGINTQTYTATTAGSDTITPTGSGTNATLGGSATQTGTTTATINVYSGVGVWKTNGGGTWGTVSATPTNWTANGGTPGITAGFANTDSASFGSILASGTGSVTLDGDNPSLNAITFNDSAASYVVAQGSGTGSITLDGNGGNANVTDLAGSHTISAPINLATSANVNVASGQQLTMSGTISGAGGLVNNGSGTTILSGNNGYSGGTTVSSGILQLSNGSGSATGSGALSVGPGATLAGTGSSSGSSFSITGGSSTRATVLVGHNTASDLNTTSVMSLTATGASSIGSANLVFNLNTNVAGQGNQLSIGATNIAFNTVGAMNTTMTLNLQGSSIIAAGTDYILVAGTTASGGSGQLGSQYTGLDLGTSVVLSSGITETKILNSNVGGSGSVNLSFGSANSYYGANSTLFLYQNTHTGQDDIEVEVVPEPGTWVMMLGGLAMLVVWQRRKNRS